MKKRILFLFISIFLLGCDSGSQTPTIVGDDTQDAPAVNDQAIAMVPHRQSSIPMLAILISYNNIAITSSDTVWAKKLFGKNENQLNNYYQEVSSGGFEYLRASESYGVINDGVVSVQLNLNHPDVSIDNNYRFSSTVYPDLKLALSKANDFVDFSNYDNDANGYITPDEFILTFIIAGYEDAYEGKHVQYGTWAHQYCMVSPTDTPTLDGVSLMGCANEGNFALFGEKHNAENPHDATIGIIAHELGHATFDLPDLYNTVNFDSGGIGYFGLMGGGTWAQKDIHEYAGNTPTHFSAWSKVYNGWIIPTLSKGYSELRETSSANYNIIKVPISTTQYYLLENRNNSGYDRGLYMLDGYFNGGIAIWKVDETKLTPDYFKNNTVNADTQNKGVDLVEASSSFIDSYASVGHEDALYYAPNTYAFGATAANISQRGPLMSLEIK